MEVLTPRSLDEALRLKSGRPEARPIAGGTDVMVELNFDRLRPQVLLNLSEVPELRSWARENGTLRLGAGLTNVRTPRFRPNMGCAISHTAAALVSQSSTTRSAGRPTAMP